MTQYAFAFDGTRCTGCKACEMACRDYKDTPIEIAFRRVYEYTGGELTVSSDGIFEDTTWSYPLSLNCNHCDEPACVPVCPVDAMTKDSTNGFVTVNLDKCIGCGMCAEACPYNVPRIDQEQKKSLKCDSCAARVLDDKKPICVEACPQRALDFGLKEDMVAKYGDEASIAPLPDQSQTKPNLVIKPSVLARPSGDTEGHIANPLEV